MIKGAIGVFAASLLVFPPQALLAQTSPSPASPPTQSASVSSQQKLSAGQLDALVAPIALYPDALLSEILMASTYPLEVVEAARWVDANKNLKGDALKAAVDKQPWDNSVKSLAATPSVLDMMSEKLTWTQQLGDALLAQQADVMDAVQRLRTKAQANKKLASNKQQTVKTEQQDGKQVIVIAPAVPDTLFVPYYDPAVVYGVWPYPAYPPYYWPAPGYIAAGVVATGIAFGVGYAVGRWTTGGYWGGGFNWGGNNININRNININNINRGSGNTWTHNPQHRQGVRYTNANVQQRFGQNNIRTGAQNRLDFRGHSGQQVLRPGGTRPNVDGSRVGSGNRRPPAQLNRPGGRTGGGNAFGNISSGRISRAEATRGRESFRGGGREIRGGGGGGGFRGGGGARGGGGGFHGGGRRSDIRLKHDIVLLGRLDDGLGFYRFVYNGGHTAYVGVMAQEVVSVMPEAVERGADGYLRVHYERLGLKFETYADWIASGAKVPAVNPVMH